MAQHQSSPPAPSLVDPSARHRVSDALLALYAKDARQSLGVPFAVRASMAAELIAARKVIEAFEIHLLATRTYRGVATELDDILDLAGARDTEIAAYRSLFPVTP